MRRERLRIDVAWVAILVRGYKKDIASHLPVTPSLLKTKRVERGRRRLQTERHDALLVQRAHYLKRATHSPV